MTLHTINHQDVHSERIKTVEDTISNTRYTLEAQFK